MIQIIITESMVR